MKNFINMKKKCLMGVALATLALTMSAQTPADKADNDQRPPQQQQQGPRPMSRPSTYQQVDDVRNKLGLDHNQFDKVYQAYNKYNNAIYGDESSSSQSFGGGRPQGGPGGGGPGGPGGGGMGGPGGGGMGGPGGGMGPGGGGQPPQGGGMAPSASASQPKMEPKNEKEMEKLRKKMDKQEQKLQKTMRKVLGSDELYDRWLKIRQQQLPMPPKGSKPEEH